MIGLLAFPGPPCREPRAEDAGHHDGGQCDSCICHTRNRGPPQWPAQILTQASAPSDLSTRPTYANTRTKRLRELNFRERSVASSPRRLRRLGLLLPHGPQAIKLGLVFTGEIYA